MLKGIWASFVPETLARKFWCCTYLIKLCAMGSYCRSLESMFSLLFGPSFFSLSVFLHVSSYCVCFLFFPLCFSTFSPFCVVMLLVASQCQEAACEGGYQQKFPVKQEGLRIMISMRQQAGSMALSRLKVHCSWPQKVGSVEECLLGGRNWLLMRCVQSWKECLLSDALGAAVPGEAVLPQRKMWGVKYMHKPLEQVLIGLHHLKIIFSILCQKDGCRGGGTLDLHVFLCFARKGGKLCSRRTALGIMCDRSWCEPVTILLLPM